MMMDGNYRLVAMTTLPCIQISNFDVFMILHVYQNKITIKYSEIKTLYYYSFKNLFSISEAHCSQVM